VSWFKFACELTNEEKFGEKLHQICDEADKADAHEKQMQEEADERFARALLQEYERTTPVQKKSPATVQQEADDKQLVQELLHESMRASPEEHPWKCSKGGRHK
jgi:uncharacterized protein YqfA (UPF0365 family)